jgi:GntR family transcriptional regulator/MocR family aminotransferase
VDNVLVTGGSREGLLLILTALGSRQLRVGVEDPGQPGLRRIITMLGHELVLCPIDQHGIDPAQLPCDLDALLVTPTHQYPIGGPLPAPRRAALLAWAQRTGTIIIEDDYCAELRYRTAPQPTLHALSAHTGSATVIVLGTFSTLLSPALSTGYVIAQPQLTNRLLDARSVLGMPAAQVTQRAIAHLLSGGYVRKHTKSVHSTLRTRARIIDSQLLPTLHAAGISTRHSGVDYLLSFPTPAHQAKFDAALSRNNLSCQHVEDTEKRVISFAHLSDADFRRVMGVIMNALD